MDDYTDDFDSESRDAMHRISTFAVFVLIEYIRR